MPELNHRRELIRWSDMDVDVVELLAFGLGLTVAGALAVAGNVLDTHWLAGVAVLAGLSVIWRALRAGRARPWWHTPNDHPGAP